MDRTPASSPLSEKTTPPPSESSRQAETIRLASALLLTGASAVLLGIARTIVANGTGYLTVGGRVLDVQESVGLLGLPGALFPAVAAAVLLGCPLLSGLRWYVVAATVLLAAGAAIPPIVGSHSSGAGRGLTFPFRRVPLDLGLVASLIGIGVIVVIAAAGARQPIAVLPALAAAGVSAMTTVLGLWSAGAPFRWRTGIASTVSSGLLVGLATTLALAAIAGLGLARRSVRIGPGGATLALGVLLLSATMLAG